MYVYCYLVECHPTETHDAGGRNENAIGRSLELTPTEQNIYRVIEKERSRKPWYLCPSTVGSIPRSAMPASCQESELISASNMPTAVRRYV